MTVRASGQVNNFLAITTTVGMTVRASGQVNNFLAITTTVGMTGAYSEAGSLGWLAAAPFTLAYPSR